MFAPGSFRDFLNLNQIFPECDRHRLEQRDHGHRLATHHRTGTGGISV